MYLPLRAVYHNERQSVRIGSLWKRIVQATIHTRRDAESWFGCRQLCKIYSAERCGIMKGLRKSYGLYHGLRCIERRKHGKNL